VLGKGKENYVILLMRASKKMGCFERIWMCIERFYPCVYRARRSFQLA
jgi:hypothetical protein